MVPYLFMQLALLMPYVSIPVVLNCGDFAPRGDLRQCPDTFLVATVGGTQ